MKFNLCTVAIAAMVVSVTARPNLPGPDGIKTKGMAVRHVGMARVGELFRRGDDDDEEEEEVEEEEDEDEGEDKDEESSSSSSEATTTGSASSGSTTGSASTGGTTGSPSTGGTTTSGGDLPASAGYSALSAVQTIAAGESFDGGMFMYDRGVECTGQSEGGDSDAVFEIENGGSLSNVIIGPSQTEGIHCFGACTLTNVWWSAVCEDAFTIKEQAAGETTTISGGGAFGGSDKVSLPTITLVSRSIMLIWEFQVMQHNGGGTLSLSDFTVGSFGKLYRACGNCDDMFERHVIISGVTATDGDLIAGINSNYGDTATITGLTSSGVETVCEQFEGNDTGDEPTSISTEADGTYCIVN